MTGSSAILVRVPASLFPEHDECAAFRVAGDSMTGDDINDGDLIILHKARVPGDGDITAVYLPGGWKGRTQAPGWTLTRVIRARDGGGVVLVPSNPAYQPAHVEPGTGAVYFGVVIGVIPADGSPARRIDATAP